MDDSEGRSTSFPREGDAPGQEGLRRTLALLAETEAITQSGGWELDVASGRITWTDGVFRIYGVGRDYDPSDIARDLSFYPPPSQAVLGAAFDRALRLGEAYDLELEFRRADGAQRWVRTAARPERRDGTVVRIVGNIVDITARKEAEIALRRSEERFRGALENIPDVVVIYGPDLRIRYVNEATRRLTGRATSEYIGRKDEELWPPEVYRSYLPTLEEALSTGETRSVDSDLTLPAVGAVHLRITCVPLVDDGGRVLEVVGVTQDLTEDRRTRAALQRTADRLQLLLNLAEDLSTNPDVEAALKRTVERLGTILPAADLRIAYLYSAAEGLLVARAHHGYDDRAASQLRLRPGESISGKAFLSGQSSLTRSPEETDAARGALGVEAVRLFRQALVGRRIASNICAPLRLRSGEILGTLTLGSTHGVFSEDDLGLLEGVATQIAQTIGSARYLAELERSERRLRESEARYRQLLDIAPLGIAVHCDGRIAFANPAGARLLGATDPAQIVGRPVRSVVHPEHWAAAVERIGRMLQGEAGLYPVEDRYVRVDGTSLPVEVMAAPLTFEGRPAVQVIAMDISARKEAEAASLRNQQQLRELTAHLESLREQERTTIAREIHDELGQALTALKIDLSNLPRLLAEVPPAMGDKTRSMAALIDTTIEAVRRIATQLRPGILDHLGLGAAIEWQAGEFEKRTGIPCRAVCEPEEMVVDAQRSTAVFRLFQEALTNVARHAGARRVEVRLTAEPEALTLVLRDDGRGIRPEEVAGTRSLGLLGMRERAKSFGGWLEVEGVAGQGTTVTARIPLAQGDGG